MGWLRAGQRAATAVEFAILAPVFVGLLIAILGAGLDGFYQLALDDALRNAARQVQINGPAAQSGALLASAVCQEMQVIATNCTGNMSYNVQTNLPPALFATLVPVNLSTSGKLPDAFAPVASGSNVLLQVAYPLPASLPFISPAITLTGTNSILATSTVRAEQHS